MSDEQAELIQQSDMLPAESASREVAQSPVLAMMADIEKVKELPVEKMERMFDLLEREYARIAEVEFNTAFVNVCREMTPIRKIGHNDSINSWFARMEEVAEMLYPILIRHGFTRPQISHGDCPLDGKVRVVMALSHEGGHTRQWHLDSSPDAPNRAKNAMQADSSTTTYVGRQLCLRVFGVQTDADSDGQSSDSGDSITKDHAAHLRSLLDDAGRTEAQYVRTKNVQSIDELLEREYEPAVKQIQRVIDQQGATA